MSKELTGYPSIDKPWLKYYSEEAINAKLPECTIYEYLRENNRNNLENIALNYFGCRVTFEKMFNEIEKATRAFCNIGVKQGDIVVMSTVTVPEAVYAFYALNRLGAIANMVDPRTSVEGIKEYITEVNAKFVLVIDVAYSKIKKAIKGTEVKQIIVISPADSLSNMKRLAYNVGETLKGNLPQHSKLCISWNKFIKDGQNNVPKIAAYKKDVCCVIVHTGGTTGSPKGVMLSNDNINALVCQSVWTGIDMRREHTWLDIMPPFIAYGIGMGLHLPLTIGMETILVPRFDAKKFDELLCKYKPNHIVGVPSYWGTIINSKKMEKADLRYIIAPTVGGDSMDVVLEQKANAFLHKHGCSDYITKGYGMTEVCAGVAGTLVENNEIGSVGVPFVKTDIAIFNIMTGEELSYNEMGEICISGPNIMLGYYKNLKATNEIIKVHKDGKKWIHSGDIGYMNEKGSLFIVDRMKRIIVRYDGFKVFPSLVEKTVLKCNKVASCCVVGKKDLEHSQGKLPMIFVVLISDFIDEVENIKKEIFELCAQELAEYAQPVEIRFVEQLPLTAIGKVDYRALEESMRYY